MKKCKYCNKKNIEDDFCSDDCKNKGERYFNYWKKYKYFFGLIITISIFVIIMQVALYPECIIVSKILTLVLGLTFFLNTHIPQVIVQIRNDSFNFPGIYV